MEIMIFYCNYKLAHNNTEFVHQGKNKKIYVTVWKFCVYMQEIIMHSRIVYEYNLREQ